MTFPKSQQGMSASRLLIALALLGFVLSVGMKMVPHYLDNRSLVGLIENVQASGAGEIDSSAEFYQQVEKGMQINAIRDIDLETVLKLTIVDNEFRAQLQYEKREVLLGNLDLVARFDNEFRVRMP